MKEKLSALIITYNEIGYIEKCIASVAFADEIIVVDSFSTDGTFEFLKNHPKVLVWQQPFSDFTSQKSDTLKKATNDWVLFLDADEVISFSLQNEILQVLNSKKNHGAYWFYRVFMFKNSPIRFSGTQTDKNIRLFRKSVANFEKGRLVHEKLEVDGTIGVMTEKLAHHCYKDFNDYKTKIIKYGKMKALQQFEKQKKFNCLLLFAKPIWKFLQRYFIRLGFLDGKKGFIICYLNALGNYEGYKELKRLERLAK
jgi:glycosyltransferase involved in cell wall biosynthesis